MQEIILYSKEKIKSFKSEKTRYLLEELDLNEKILWISWLRGCWKTSILLQLAKKSKNSIYFSMDSFFINQWLFEIVKMLKEDYWFENFFIDEIHTFKNWSQELKNIYDFLDVKIVFSWSSSMDLKKWNFDLSRRVILKKLEKLSFREFLDFNYWIKIKSYSIDEILKNYKKISLNIFEQDQEILAHFKDYLRYWELPFFLQWKNTYHEKIKNAVDKVIYDDILKFHNLKTENIFVFFDILKFLINSSPSNFNYSNLANSLSVSVDTIKYFSEILSEVWLVNLIWKEWKVSVNLRKSKKAFLELSNLSSLFFNWIDSAKNLWFIRESFCASNLKKVWSVFYSEVGDLLFIKDWERFIFEIWWKNKTKSQLKWIDNWILIKDDIKIWWDWELPIWLLGFLY